MTIALAAADMACVETLHVDDRFAQQHDRALVFMPRDSSSSAGNGLVGIRVRDQISDEL